MPMMLETVAGHKSKAVSKMLDIPEQSMSGNARNFPANFVLINYGNPMLSIEKKGK